MACIDELKYSIVKVERITDDKIKIQGAGILKEIEDVVKRVRELKSSQVTANEDAPGTVNRFLIFFYYI